MTLQEAIEIATIRLKGGPYLHEPHFHDAVNLLIEAGKRETGYRESETREAWQLLPGETED